jgi:probable F420-dependent oxidoreductase
VVVADDPGVPDELEGQGIGGRLVRAAVDAAAREDLTIVPRCPFARDWLKRHPDETARATIARERQATPRFLCPFSTARRWPADADLGCSVMEIGLFAPVATLNAGPAFLRALGPAVEERGFESIWVPEHVVMFDDYDSPYPYSPDGRFPGGSDTGLLEPLTALTYLAAVTDRVRLGTAICLIPQRNPVYTAKQVADLDVLSGGRIDFGIGIGWLREEYEVLNVPFERRGKRADEYLALMRSLWSDGTAALSGEFYELPECRLYPKPLQSPVPVHVGGESDAALRRAAANGQGWFSWNRLPGDDLTERLAPLDGELAARGRSRSDDDFELTICPYFNPITPEMVEQYAAAGVDRLLAMCMAFGPDDLQSTLDDLASSLLEPSRG